MTTTEWLHAARHDGAKIRSLIASFHPASREFTRTDFKITAPRAEVACEHVRQSIKTSETDPIERFDRALAQGDVSSLMSLMNAAWFGVPESTSCWRVEGFSEAVALLEDPPEDEGETT